MSPCAITFQLESNTIYEQPLEGRYYRLELTLRNTFLTRRLSITVQYFMLLVCQDEKNTLTDKDAAGVSVFFSCV